ncbi:MAG TPA: radical SAM protein [Verrucomicrobiae bacterium]|nr:radical SAM protein [Verrucomicrobiae bacterium]
MRALLVYTNRTRVMEPAPPIGLSYIATAARDEGHQIRFLDLMPSRKPLDDLKKALSEFRPEIVGFSIRNIDNTIAQRVSRHLPEVAAMVRIVREDGDAKIVIGGPAVSILGAAALESLDADFALVGEGEVAFPQLLEALERGWNVSGVNGICCRENGKTISVPPIRLEKFGPSGMEDWIDWRPYERAGAAWALNTKRGCPLNCLYCNYPMMEGHRLRMRPAGDVVNEIERVSRIAAPRAFEFTDSTFNLPESHAIEICEEIIRRKLRVSLSAVSVNPAAVSADLFALMKRAGFRCLAFSPDAASDSMLGNLCKGFDTAQISRAVELARQSGIRCTWFFLLGGPGETHKTVEETISFAEKHLNSKKFLTIFMTGIRLLPGTGLAEKAIAEKYLSPKNNLCEPEFYFSREVNESWVLRRINKAIANCPGIVHGAEEGSGSLLERAFNRALYWMRVPPPYYRFLPTFLRIPPLPALRARNTGVRATCRKD